MALAHQLRLPGGPPPLCSFRGARAVAGTFTPSSAPNAGQAWSSERASPGRVSVLRVGMLAGPSDRQLIVWIRSRGPLALNKPYAATAVFPSLGRRARTLRVVGSRRGVVVRLAGSSAMASYEPANWPNFLHLGGEQA